MTKHNIGDLLPGGREIIAVDDSLRRYDENGEVVASGVEYHYIIQEEGDAAVLRKFQSWGG